MAQFLEIAMRGTDQIKGLFRKDTYTNSSLRPLSEFFDHARISRPQDTNEAFQRITYNTRHFSGNYFVVIGALAMWGLITSPLLLVAIAFLVVSFQE